MAAAAGRPVRGRRGRPFRRAVAAALALAWAAAEDGTTSTWRPADADSPSVYAALPCSREYAAPANETAWIGSFLRGRFLARSFECPGEWECTFPTLSEATRFCDKQSDCTGVLWHPFHPSCESGSGCYTPRSGKVHNNSQFGMLGGKLWKKGLCDFQGTQGSLHASEYFLASTSASPEAARSLCKPQGRLAMPKTEHQKWGLLAAITVALGEQKLVANESQPLVWLGGHLGDFGQWGWDDGTGDWNGAWAHGQPGSSQEQAQRPYLSIGRGGKAHAAGPDDQLAVLCEPSPSNRIAVMRGRAALRRSERASAGQ